MAYTKQTWINDTSPVNAERLNHMEEGIYGASVNGENALKSSGGTITGVLNFNSSVSGIWKQSNGNNGVNIYGNNEGGNIRLYSPDNTYLEWDSYNNTISRIYSVDDDGNVEGNIQWNRDTYNNLNLALIGRGNLQTGTDLNTLTDTEHCGIYLLNGNYTFTNLPVGFTYGYLEVFKASTSASWTVQRITNALGSAYRFWSNNTWQPWRIELYDSQTFTYKGLTCVARRTGTITSIYVYGTVTEDLATINSYETLGTLKETLRPSISYINMTLLSTLWAGQLNAYTDGTLKLGYTRNYSTNAASNLTRDSSIYAHVVYEIG